MIEVSKKSEIWEWSMYEVESIVTNEMVYVACSRSFEYWDFGSM